jgi:hypothetical protein
MRWLRKNDVIIGCEDKGIEYNLMAICQNVTLHQLYHDQLKKDHEKEIVKEGEQDEYVS